ncbi:MAG TPA: hypothetical protein VFS31_05105, partial [Chitinophagaceae bacterium]|nr:hypothetical protein [Chitinophagaceae bacterium]
GKLHFHIQRFNGLSAKAAFNVFDRTNLRQLNTKEKYVSIEMGNAVRELIKTGFLLYHPVTFACQQTHIYAVC